MNPGHAVNWLVACPDCRGIHRFAHCPWSLTETDPTIPTCGHCGQFVDTIECTDGSLVLEDHTMEATDGT